MTQKSIEDLIQIGTPSALNEALLLVEGEVGCNQLETHPLFKRLTLKITSLAISKMDGETLTA